MKGLVSINPKLSVATLQKLLTLNQAIYALREYMEREVSWDVLEELQDDGDWDEDEGVVDKDSQVATELQDVLQLSKEEFDEHLDHLLDLTTNIEDYLDKVSNYTELTSQAAFDARMGEVCDE